MSMSCNFVYWVRWRSILWCFMLISWVRSSLQPVRFSIKRSHDGMWWFFCAGLVGVFVRSRVGYSGDLSLWSPVDDLWIRNNMKVMILYYNKMLLYYYYVSFCLDLRFTVKCRSCVLMLPLWWRLSLSSLSLFFLFIFFFSWVLRIEY